MIIPPFAGMVPANDTARPRSTLEQHRVADLDVLMKLQTDLDDMLAALFARTADSQPLTVVRPDLVRRIHGMSGAIQSALMRP